MSTVPVQGIHPYADKFPMLSDVQLAELAESIAANGLRNPIVLTEDGLILDGRNRLKACELAEVKPEFEIYTGDDLAEYVIDCNSSRRHMSTGARAMATALVLAEDGRRTGGRWSRGSVDIGESPNIETWRDALKKCGLILDYVPALAPEVVAGHLALDAAHRKACEARDAERRKLAEQERIAAEEADAKAFVEAQAPELAALVGNTFQSFAEAQAVWEKRNREEAARLAAEKAAKAKAEKDARDERSQRYSSIGKHLLALSAYGRYEDPAVVMREFDPTELMPTTLASEFEPEALRRSMHFIQSLITWTESRHG